MTAEEMAILLMLGFLAIVWACVMVVAVFGTMVLTMTVTEKIMGWGRDR